MRRQFLIVGVMLALAAAGATLSGARADDAGQAAIAAALAAGDGAGAQQLADTALQSDGLSPVTQSALLLERGEAKVLQGHHDDALADFTQVIDAANLPPADRARAFFDRGLALDTLNRLDDAVGDYSAALKLTPGSAPALNNRANALRRLGRDADARRDYLASLAAGNPAPEYPYYGLGQVAEHQGDTAAALGYYRQAVAADPGYQLAADRLAALGGFKVVAENGANDGPIILKPPGSTPAKEPIHLHPPKAMTPAPKVVPAGYAPDAGLSLRPALSGSEEQRGDVPLTSSAGATTGASEEVQLGSWRSEQEAADGWNRIRRQATGALDGLSPHIVAADLPGRGRFYRLRVGPVAGGPSRFCASLTALGLDCIPARD